MRRTARYLTLAALSVLTELIIGLVANSVRFPRQVYIIPVVALIVVIAITVVTEFIHDSPPKQAGATLKRTRAAAAAATDMKDSDVLLGRKIKKGSVSYGYICFVLALFLALFSVYYLSNHNSFWAGYHKANPLTSSICASIAVALIIVGFYFTVGIRARLGFSAAGVSLRDDRGEFFISWDAVTDMYTESPWIKAWLLAKVPPKSPLLFRGPWVPDRGKKYVIRICDLNRCGINRDAVDGALHFWAPFN